MSRLCDELGSQLCEINDLGDGVDLGVSSRKAAPVGVEKPAYAGVFLAAHGVFLIVVVQQST